jgi:hypothetical protein
MMLIFIEQPISQVSFSPHSAILEKVEDRRKGVVGRVGKKVNWIAPRLAF